MRAAIMVNKKRPGKAPAYVFSAHGVRHVIPGPVWGALMTKAKAYGEDPYRVLYRILTRKPQRIVPFIRAALRAEDRWPFKPCIDEIKQPRKVNDWCQRWGAHDWGRERAKLGGNHAEADSHRR